MSDKAKTFWLGVFIIAGLFVIGWFVIFLRPTYGNGEKHLKVRFTNVDMVISGTRVAFAGYPIGEVANIRKIPNARDSAPDADGNLYFFELDLEVDSSVHVFTYDEIVFSTSGLLGERTINIIPRPTPPGSPPATETTDCILYAKSEDKVEQVLNQIIKVSKSFDDSLKSLGQFFDTNQEKASLALEHISGAMIKAETLFDTIHPVTKKIATGEGALSQLIYSDDFYIRMNSVLMRLEFLLNDMNQYGIFYQFSGKWRRARNQREACYDFGSVESQSKLKEALNQLEQLTQDVTNQNEKFLADYDEK